MGSGSSVVLKSPKTPDDIKEICEKITVRVGLSKNNLSDADLHLLPPEGDIGHWSWTVGENAGIWKASEDLKLFASCVAEWPIRGHLSPPCTLDGFSGSDRSNFLAPESATLFGWGHSTDIQLHTGLERDMESLTKSQDPEVMFFLRGGYILCDEGYKVCCVSILLPTEAGCGIQFTAPQRWDAKWTPLFERRFKKVTIKELYDDGVRYYCWIGPDDPSWAGNKDLKLERGGFVYLFHDDILDSSSDSVELDFFASITEVRPTRLSNVEQFSFVSSVWNEYSKTMMTPYAALATHLRESRDLGAISDSKYLLLMRALNQLVSGNRRNLILDMSEETGQADVPKRHDVRTGTTASTSSSMSALSATWLPLYGVQTKRHQVRIKTREISTRQRFSTESCPPVEEMMGNLDTLKCIEHDAFETPKEDIIPMMVLSYHEPWQLLSQLNIKQKRLSNWIAAIRSQYQDVPYHQWSHAWDTLQMAFIQLSEGKTADLFLSKLEILSLVTAAIAHDVGHPGLTNVFLCRTNAEVAITYNDASVLENMHVSVLFKTLLRDEELNFLQHLEQVQYDKFRKKVIPAVLATDMSHHFKMVDELHAKAQMLNDRQSDKKTDEESTMDSITVISAILHFADISPCCRSADIFLSRTEIIEKEFFLQGDKERELGLPISPMMDREDTKLVKSQEGFINFLVAPLLSQMKLLIPGLHDELTSRLQKSKDAVVAAAKEIDEILDQIPESARNQE